MPAGLISGLYIVPILAILILVHEIGHFVAARSIGVKVEEFGIGLPPRIKGWRRKGVLWSLNWIPFGGFVRVLGEDGKSTDPASINAKSPLQRAMFLVAGSFMNVLLAVVLIIFIVGFQGVLRFNTYIVQVSPGSPAEAAGWLAGDRLVEVAGVPVTSTEDMGQRAREFAGKPLSVVVERDRSLIETTVTPRVNPPANEGPTGVEVNAFALADAHVDGVLPDSPAAIAGLQVGDKIVAVDSTPVTDAFALQSALTAAAGGDAAVQVARGDETETFNVAVPATDADADVLSQVGLDIRLRPQFDKVPWSSVIPVGLGEAWHQMTMMLGMIRDLLTGRGGLGGIAGPIGMGQATSELVQGSLLPVWVTLTQLAILLSLNLAVLNLLPLPALDGGRLLFVIVEVLRGGKKLAPEREGIVHFAGLILLLGFMIIVAFLDIGRIMEGRPFLP